MFRTLVCVQRGDAQSRLAISERSSPAVHLYDARSGSAQPTSSCTCHRQPVVALRYNEKHDTVISTDTKGASEALVRAGSLSSAAY